MAELTATNAHGTNIASLLVACLRSVGAQGVPGRLLDALRRADPGVLVAAAEHHGVAPVLYRLVRRWPDVPAATREGLEQVYLGQWQLQLRVLGDLGELTRVLDGLGVRWAVFKGPVLAEAIYDRGIPRSYVDLDVLVSRCDLPVVLESLEAEGARVTDRNWDMPRPDVLGQLGLVLRHGSALDLHWHLLNDSRVRRAFSVSTGELLERTRRVAVNRVPTPTFDAADTLVHVAAHAALNGGDRLLWFKDLEQVLVHDSPEWDLVVQRAQASGLSLAVATMLERTSRLLDADVPSEILDALAPPRGWRAAVRLADRLRPPGQPFGSQLTGRTLVAATRRSMASSAAALAHSLAVEVAGRLVTDPGHPWRAHFRRHPLEPSVAPAEKMSSDVDRDEVLRRVRRLARAPSDP